jgi:hypothetical protein
MLRGLKPFVFNVYCVGLEVFIPKDFKWRILIHIREFSEVFILEELRRWFVEVLTLLEI